MSKNINVSITAFEASITPRQYDKIDVDLTVADTALIDLLPELDIVDIISYLEENGYDVTKED